MNRPTPFERLIAEFDEARFHSPKRGEIIKRYAAEKGLTTMTAHRRLTQMRDQLDMRGNLARHRPRKDKGQPRQGHYKPEMIQTIKEALKDRSRTLRSVASDLNVTYHFVRLIERGKL